MVNRNLIRGLDLNEQDWEKDLQEALGSADPMTFETSDGSALIGPNQIAKGTILRIDGDRVLIDVGYKSEGTIALNEWGEDEEPPKPGDVGNVLIEDADEAQPQDDAGLIVLTAFISPFRAERDMVRKMRPGAVIVDVAIDQGGCFEDSKATTHAEPTYAVHNSIFYCVANMPGAVPVTSTYALTNATLPYALAIANKGWQKALKDDANLAKGLNVCDGTITYEAVAKAHGYQFAQFIY